MIEPFVKGSGFLQLPLGEKENENVLFIYLKRKRIVYVFFPQMRNISPKTLRSIFLANFQISNLHKLEYCRSIFLEHI